MARPTRQSDEPTELAVSLPLTIRYSQLAVHGALDLSGFHGFHSFVRRFPWLGLAVTVALLVTWYQVSTRLRAPVVEWLWVPIFVLGLLFCALQTLLRSDRLTAAGVERRTWLLVRRVKLIPYRAIEAVEVDYPRFGPLVDVGDLIVHVRGDSHLFIGIRDPREIAAAIEHLRRSA